LKMRKYSVSKQTRCKCRPPAASLSLRLPSDSFSSRLLSSCSFRCDRILWLLFLRLYFPILDLSERRFQCRQHVAGKHSLPSR
jgi:hypothetical protein